MSVFDCSKEINSLHDEEVTLGESERRDMRERRNAGRTRLRTGLEQNNHSLPKLICSQGSYQMRTMVQDDDLDYDIDDGVYFRPADLRDGNGIDLTPRAARERVCDALSRDQRFASPAEVHDNCVRQEYQLGYHIDMPVYRIRVDNKGTPEEVEIYELASGDAWQVSDARAVTRWFRDAVKDLNGEEGDDGSQMQRLVRLTKAFARSRPEWKDATTSGIAITKLIVDAYVPYADRDDQALLEIWKVVEARLKVSTAIDHPINPTPLAQAGNAKVRFFQEKLTAALAMLKMVEEPDCTRNEARQAWDEVFNTDYLGKLPDPKDPGSNDPDAGKKAFFVATESKSDKRDDGNGRYGGGGGS